MREWNGSKYGGESKETAQKTIIVPTAQVGKLVGTGGNTIKRLREETMAKIHIQDKDARGSRDTKVGSRTATVNISIVLCCWPTSSSISIRAERKRETEGGGPSLRSPSRRTSVAYTFYLPISRCLMQP